MSEQYNGKNFTENESGLLVPENTLHKPTKAEISGYGNKPNYLSEQNDGELIKDQMQKEADEKAYKEILNPANVIELKQSIEVAQGRVGTKSDTANMGLNLKREKEAIRSKLIEEYLHTGDRDNNRTITDEVRQKLEEMLRQSYARLESDMNAEISNADNTEAENEEEPTTEANTVNSKEDDNAEELDESNEEDEILKSIAQLRFDLSKLQKELRELREGKTTEPRQRLVAVSNGPTEIVGRNNNSNERQSNRRRNLLCALGSAAALGAAVAALWAHGLNDGTSKEKVSNGPKVTKEVNKGVDTYDQRLSEHTRNKTIEKGFEKGMSPDAARDLLIKQLGHRGEVLAVMNYAVENGINVDKARSHVGEIQNDTKKMIGTEFDSNGRLSLTSYGQETHQRIAAMLNNATVSWVDGNEKQGLYNSGIAQGKLQNGRDDLLRINQNAGFDADVKILKIEFKNGIVVYLKENCVNFLWKGGTSLGSFKMKDGTTVKVTMKDKGQPINNEAKMDKEEAKIPQVEKKEQPTQPEESNPVEPTPTPTPEKPPTGLTPKNPSEAPAGHDNGNHLAPTPELKPDTNIDGVTGGNPTNPQPEPTTPRAPENIPPVETNTETGQNANGNDGINDAPKNPSTGKPQQQNPNDI